LLQTKTDPIGVWPQTSMYDWCGEYEPVGAQDPAFESEEESPVGNTPTVTVSQDWSLKP